MNGESQRIEVEQWPPDEGKSEKTGTAKDKGCCVLKSLSSGLIEEATVERTRLS